MADTVNPQVVDAVTLTDAAVVGNAPAVAMGMLYQVAASATGLSMQNATALQNGMQQVGIAVVSTVCAKILTQSPSSTS